MAIPDSDWVSDQCRSRRLSYPRAGAVQDILRVVEQQRLDDAGVWAALGEAGDEAALDIERQRIAEHRLTYDDLPRLAELILHNASVADLYRCLFTCVIVDEFQDLTPQLLRMTRQIGYGRTTYAGDIAQGIYGFAGAAPVAVLNEVEQETTKKIIFADSHRSSPPVLEMVNALALHRRTAAAKRRSSQLAQRGTGRRGSIAHHRGRSPMGPGFRGTGSSHALLATVSASSPGRHRGAGSPTQPSSSHPFPGTGGMTRCWIPKPRRS